MWSSNHWRSPCTIWRKMPASNQRYLGTLLVQQTWPRDRRKHWRMSYKCKEAVRHVQLWYVERRNDEGDRLVSGVRGDSIREKLLGKKDLTLDKAIEMLRSHHATQLFSKDMASEETNIHSLGKKNKHTRNGPFTRKQNESHTVHQTHSCKGRSWEFPALQVLWH